MQPIDEQTLRRLIDEARQEGQDVSELEATLESMRAAREAVAPSPAGEKIEKDTAAGKIVIESTGPAKESDFDDITRSDIVNVNASVDTRVDSAERDRISGHLGRPASIEVNSRRHKRRDEVVVYFVDLRVRPNSGAADTEDRAVGEAQSVAGIVNQNAVRRCTFNSQRNGS